MNYTVRDKFGQMIMLGLDTYEINSEIEEIIKTYKIGGVVLYQKNYISIEEMVSFINKLKEINGNNIPLFIATDQENGRVNRFPKDVERIYNPYKQASLKSDAVVNYINEITTDLLNRVGVNMNFAPVVDICKSPKKGIGNRSYGKTKEDVIKYAIPFMKCMKRNNIISVVKHFPGIGSLTTDTHIMASLISNTKSLLKKDLPVFSECVNQGCDAIMLSHVRVNNYGIYKCLENKEIIDKLLKKKVGFSGLIVADDLRMNYSSFIKNTKNSVKRCVNAGCNLLIIKYRKGDLNFYDKLFKMIDTFDIDIECVNDSFCKIVDIKKRYNVNSKALKEKINVDSINKKIIKVNNILDKGEML